MKPINEFNDFMKRQIWNHPEFTRKNCLNLENLRFRWKRVSLRENVSLRVCQKCVTQGMSTVFYIYLVPWIFPVYQENRDFIIRFDSKCAIEYHWSKAIVTLRQSKRIHIKLRSSFCEYCLGKFWNNKKVIDFLLIRFPGSVALSRY